MDLAIASCWYSTRPVFLFYRTDEEAFFKTVISNGFFFFAFSQMTGEKRPSSEMMKPKPKPQKKKKKKDPNEPTKPVSAYALFFRDTQAAIKGQNPNATFGDVSKIVASMWDGLGEEQKQVRSLGTIKRHTQILLVLKCNYL